MLSAIVPSLLMQTTQRFRNETCSSSIPFNILCSQPENYRNWLMLQEIVRLKQMKSNEPDESEQENNEEDSEEIPLDLSLKLPLDPSSTQKPSSSTKTHKSTLTPLQEQDMTKYSYIDTVELVQTIKDILSRHSISQRHFGEKVLGLSQGSVR
jgi:hypothetical protein